jgi:Putative adhesin
MIPQSKKAALQHTLSVSAVLLMVIGIAGNAHAGDYSKSFTVGSRPTVHVDTNDGSVNIVTNADVNQVEFHVDYSGYEIDKNLRIDSQQSGDNVTLTARISNSWHFTLGNFRRLRIEVRMPRDADLRVETGDGSIKAANLAGAVDLRTGDGSLQVSAIKGSLQMRTGDGGVDASDIDGTISAVSGDGHITVEGRFDVLQAKSGDGRINVRVRKGSKLDSSWSVISGDGSIEVAIPNDLSADIDANSHDGSVSTDVPLTIQGTVGKSRLRGKLNGGGQTLTIHTGDGSIHLRET